MREKEVEIDVALRVVVNGLMSKWRQVTRGFLRGCCWGDSLVGDVGLRAASASLLVTHWREELPCRGTWTCVRNRPVRTS